MLSAIIEMTKVGIVKRKPILAKHKEIEFLFLLITRCNLYIKIKEELKVIIAENKTKIINNIKDEVSK